MIFDEFDKIFVVNLESRNDRRVEMLEQLALVGLQDDPRVHFFSAIKVEEKGPFLRSGSHGAFLSHLSILRSQAINGETVLILQDDCNFFPGVTKAGFVDKNWEIFYGGYHQLDSGDVHASGIQGAHCMAFRSTVIRPLVEFLEAVYDGSYEPQDHDSNDSERVAPPIDGAIVWFRRAHPEIRTVFQKISYQRSSRTDIGDTSFIDRMPFLARILRKAIRAFRRVETSA